MSERRGTVWIAPATALSPPPLRMVDPARGRFWVSWQDSDREGNHFLIEDDEIDGASAAIDWGRERATRVFIRLGRENATYFTAGDETGFASGDENAFPAWPPLSEPSDGWWLPAPD